MTKRAGSPHREMSSGSPTLSPPPAKRTRNGGIDADLADPPTLRSTVPVNPAVDDSTETFYVVGAMPKQKASEIPHNPVLPIPFVPNDSKMDPYYRIVSFVNHVPDLLSLCLTCKLLYVPAMKRLWSGRHFPSAGYLSVGVLLLDLSGMTRKFAITLSSYPPVGFF